jgi:seryl-tRNA synthetase
MKTSHRFITAFAILLAATLTACKDKPAAPAAGTTAPASDSLKQQERETAKRLEEQKSVADEAVRTDRARTDRQQNADALAGIIRRWKDTLGEATKTGRGEIGGVIQKMTAIRAEAQSLQADECVGTVRTQIWSAMNNYIEAYTQFSKETGSPNEALQPKLQEAAGEFVAAEASLARCRQ